MPETILTSRAHPLLKIGRSIHTSKGRREHGVFLVEGTNAFEAALNTRWPLREIFASEGERDWSARATQQGFKVHRASRDWLGAMCESQTPPPVVAWGEIPPVVEKIDLKEGLVVVLDGVADPGNVGTLWRAADALGAKHILCTQNTADRWNPKVVRGAAGSLFSLPPVTLHDDSPATIARLLREQNVSIVRADAHGTISLEKFDWPLRAALVLGHETRGVSAEFEGASITIPIRGQAESLNVAMAGTIFLWEWSRSLNTGKP